MLDESGCTLQLLEAQVDVMRKMMCDLAEAFDEALLMVEREAGEATAEQPPESPQPGMAQGKREAGGEPA